MAIQRREFLGVGVAFPLRFSNVGGVKSLRGISSDSDVDRIRSSLLHILSTGLGDRPMRRNFGSKLRNLLFQHADHQLVGLAEVYVREAIEVYEPRISGVQVSIDLSQREEGIVTFNIEFQIISSQVQGNLVFPFYLSDRSFSGAGNR